MKRTNITEITADKFSGILTEIRTRMSGSNPTLSWEGLTKFVYMSKEDHLVFEQYGMGTPNEKQPRAISADNEYFEQIFESDYITIPDMITVVAYAKDKWSKEMGSVTPSTLLVAGEKKKVKVFRFKKGPSSQRCVDFIKAQGAALPNVFGLAVAEMTVGSQLPRDKWILGFDNRDNLSVYADGSRGVPRLYLDSDGSVRRGWSSWDGVWFAVYCLVLLCD